MDARKETLKNYIDACELIRETEHDIERIKKRMKTIATDKVQASNPEFPYQPISVTITGTPDLGRNDSELRRQMKLLKERKARCEALRTEAEAMLNTLPPRIIRIVRARYFRGETWESVAASVGRGATANGIRMELNRFFDGEEL